jgi:SsrA-binding protein
MGATIALNRRARHDFEIGETLEAGLVLTGSEVKSLRNGQANIADSYARDDGGELFLVNAYIPEYAGSNRFNHAPKRPRKLLLKSREVARLRGAIAREGLTLIPLKLYFNDRGIAKLELGVAKGRKTVDKRHAIKQREWDRQKARVLREHG